MIKIGCTGYPVSKSKYYERLVVVELPTLLDKPHSPALFDKWRSGAPDNFEFVVGLPSGIFNEGRKKSLETRGLGRYKVISQRPSVTNLASLGQTPLVHWLARTIGSLQSKLVFLALPAGFSPTADNIGKLQTFMKTYHRLLPPVVWNPPTGWPENLVRDVSLALHFIPASNPLDRVWTWNKNFHYFRITRKRHDNAKENFSNESLMRIRQACQGKPSYVIFDTGPFSFHHALSFHSIFTRKELTGHV